MSNPADLLSLSFVAGIVALLVGLISLRRGRRVGTQPHCRKCDYLLIGISPDRCPECGSVLETGNIVLGERHWSRFWTIFARVNLLVGLLCFGFTIWTAATDSRINWYHYRPTSWVMDDLRNGTGKPDPPNDPNQLIMGHGWLSEKRDLARYAFDELQRREKRGDLPEIDRNAIVEMGLAVQKSGQIVAPVQYDVLGYLCERMAAGDLPADQQNRFYQSAVRATLDVRSRVIDRDSVPVRISTKKWLTWGGSWAVTRHILSTSIDENYVNFTPKPSPYPTWLSSDFSEDLQIPALWLGKHQLKVTMLLQFHYGSQTWSPDRGPIVHSETQELSAPFETVLDTPANAIQLKSDPAIAAKLRAALNPIDFVYGRPGVGPSAIDGSLDGQTDPFAARKPFPTNVAFDAFARYGGHEYPMSSFAISAGNSGGGQWLYSGDAPLPAPPATIDIILRPSTKTARTTTDEFSIWGGEIDYSNVPISNQAPPAAHQ